MSLPYPELQAAREKYFAAKKKFPRSRFGIQRSYTVNAERKYGIDMHYEVKKLSHGTWRAICEHLRLPFSCVKCNPALCCEHKKRKRGCKECKRGLNFIEAQEISDTAPVAEPAPPPRKKWKFKIIDETNKAPDM